MPLPGSNPKSATILLVEDHDDSRDAMRQIIAALGHRVLTARNGREALGLLETTRPDLILCDLRMPGMDGFAVMAAIHKNPRLAAVTVLAVTGRDDCDPRIRAAGFAGHMLKPLDYEAITAALDQWLGRDTAA
jgi:two-component system cell cycle response regulator